jgi:hypothetical protein
MALLQIDSERTRQNAAQLSKSADISWDLTERHHAKVIFLPRRERWA